MATWVVDKGLDVLLAQLNAHAPNRRKDSDGSIGDADHQSRTSAHNPQDTEDSADGNDPDNQVDARDFTHDPANGADMHQMTEEIRLSRDPRVELVIWDEEQFSSYSTPTRKAWEWGPYSGENDHTKHAHVQVRDKGNDNTAPWKVFMSLSPKQDAAVISTEWRLWYISQLQETGKNPANGLTEKYPLVTLLKALAADVIALRGEVAELKGMLKVQGAQILDIASDVDALTIPQPAPVDPETLLPVVKQGTREVLREGVA